MFEEVKAELGKVEGVIKGAFGDVKTAITKQKTLVQTLDADLLSAYDKLGAAAKKAETSVKSRLTDVRSSVEKLIT